MNGLVAFLGDMGLLGNRITVLEIENICRTIYSSRESSHSSTNSRQLMTYEEFYLWLREIACCLYYEQLLCPKKSLHKLLVEVSDYLDITNTIFRKLFRLDRIGVCLYFLIDSQTL